MKVAVFTPLNPARSGISDYSESLLPEMAKHLDLTVFIDDGYEANGFPPEAGIAIRNHREYRPEDFDETLYQFGNTPYHVYVYDALLRHPGVILLHEANLHHLLADVTIKRGDWDGYMREVACPSRRNLARTTGCSASCGWSVLSATRLRRPRCSAT